MGAGVAGFAAPGNAAVLVRAYGYAPLSSRTLRRLSCRRVAARGVRGTTNAGSEKRDAEADAPPASEETPARRPGWLRALRGIRGRVRALGVGGIIAYGMLNVVMYGTLIPVMVWRVRRTARFLALQALLSASNRGFVLRRHSSLSPTSWAVSLVKTLPRPGCSRGESLMRRSPSASRSRRRSRLLSRAS